MTALFAVLAFAGAAVLDVVHVVYLRAVERGQAHAAARWSVVIYAIGCAGFYLCVDRGWAFMLPEALGYYVGTWLAMHVSRHDARNDACTS
jgi:hypothetical protein